jgi:energy-coupling factor transporter ATP-binding protein EcfA2
MMPEGYAGDYKIIEKFERSDKLNQKPSSLSGGENQRVALAQALMFNPEGNCIGQPAHGAVG